MSWLKAALNRAAEAAGAGGKSIGPNLGRAKLFAGSVVQTAGSAVAGGARAVLERASAKHYNNFRHAVRRLDEVSLNARGEERTQALARWLGALKDLDRDAKVLAEKAERASGTEEISSPKLHSPHSNRDAEDEITQQTSRVAQVLFYDPEISSDPLTFRDVFLRSNALENITVSLVLEPPEDEEVNLVLQMFGLCLAGGPELHNAILSGIQDLGKAVANYSEIMLKRDDLLRMAADAISGLKISAEVERLETEALRIEGQITEKLALVTLKDTPGPRAEPSSEGNHGILSDVPSSVRDGAAVSEDLLHLGTRLVELWARKEALIQQGDTAEIRQLKVEKMKLLAEELAAKAKEQKARIAESRQQKSDAMAYRVTKAQEVQEAEKIISQEMQVLQKRREELEAELEEVMQAIAVQTKKHIHIQEEKEQFDEASSHIVAHLAIQEEELSQLISQHSSEAGVAGTWRSFLEDTWLLQTSCMETKEKAVKEAMKATKAHFWEIAVGHLVYRQEELDALLLRLKMYNEELSTIRAKKSDLEKKGMDGIVADITSGRKKIEEKYVETESQVKNVLVAVEAAKADLKFAMDSMPEGEDKAEKQKVEELLASLDVARRDFDSIKRPKLDIENPVPRSRKPASKSSESWSRSPPGVARTVASQGPTGAAETWAQSPTPPAKPSPAAKASELNVEPTQAEPKTPPERSVIEDKEMHGREASKEGAKEGSTDGWEFDDLEEEAKESQESTLDVYGDVTATDSDHSKRLIEQVSEGLDEKEDNDEGGVSASGLAMMARELHRQVHSENSHSWR